MRQMTPKISDLGLCKKLKEGESGVSVTKGLLGTLGWAAPELETGRIVRVIAMMLAIGKAFMQYSKEWVAQTNLKCL